MQGGEDVEALDGVEITGSRRVKPHEPDKKNKTPRATRTPKALTDSDKDSLEDDSCAMKQGSDSDYQDGNESDDSIKARSRSRGNRGSGAKVRGSSNRARQTSTNSVAKAHTATESAETKPVLEFDQYWAKIEELEEKVRKTTEEKNRQQRIKENKNVQKANLKESWNLQKARVEKLQAEKNQLLTDLKTAKDELRLSRKNNKEQDQKIEALQQESLQLLTKGKLATHADDEVEALFSSLMKETRKWTYAWSVRSWRDVGEEGAKQIANSLFRGEPNSFATARIAKAVVNSKIPPRVILNAMCNEAICRATFIRPFSVLKTNGKGTYDESANDRLQELHGYASEHSLAEGQQLRTVIFQSILLDGKQKRRTKHLKTHVSELIVKHGQYTQGQIIAQTSTLLRNCSEEERKQCWGQLSDIVHQFVEAGIELGAQRPLTRVAFRSGLSSFKFALGHQYFEAHRGLKLDTATEDAARALIGAAEFLDREVDMYVEPAVLRYGNPDGEDYDKERTIYKGTVWMVKDEDLQDAVSNNHAPGKAESGLVAEHKASVATASSGSPQVGTRTSTNASHNQVTAISKAPKVVTADDTPPTPETTRSSSQTVKKASAKQVQRKKRPSDELNPSVKISAKRSRTSSGSGQNPTEARSSSQDLGKALINSIPRQEEAGGQHPKHGKVGLQKHDSKNPSRSILLFIKPAAIEIKQEPTSPTATNGARRVIEGADV